MAKTAPHEKKDRSRPWQRAATRAAILAAARRLAGRVGIESLSLTAVAREADFAPATVFAYFANKNDLFLSVLADDLARFARTMGANPGPHDAVKPESTAAEPSGAPAPRLSLANRLRLVETPNAGFDALVVGANEAALQEDIALHLRDALAHGGDEVVDTVGQNVLPDGASVGIAQELARLRDAVTRLEARPVDQWLERRLREFERGLAALEGRSEKTEVASNLAAIDDTLRKLGTRVDALETRQTEAALELPRTLRERNDQVEKRLREWLSDAEAANTRALTRIDALENAAFAVAPHFFQSDARTAPAELPPDVAVAPVTQDVTPPAVSDPTPVAGPEAVPAAPGDKSYLSAARRSALAAAEQGTKAERAGPMRRRLTKRTLYLVATGLALVVALVWTGVLVKAVALPADEHVAATSQPGPQTALVRAPLRSPLLTAAYAGDASAERTVGLGLLNGPHKNSAVAARWLLLAAEQGDAIAAYRLGTVYRSGHGLATDPARAFQWFGFAARKGNCKAMQALAIAYAEGWGTGKDASLAAHWFQRAASLGLTDAQFNLGVLYEQGLGVPQSLTDAYKWYLIAAGAGDHEAALRVDALKTQIDSSDLAAAEEAAASFKPAARDQNANDAPVQPTAG